MSTSRLLNILVLLVNSEFFVDDIFILAILIIRTVVIIIFIVVIIVALVIVVLCNIFLPRRLIILIHDSNLVTILAALLSIQRVLPRPRTLLIFLRRNIDLLLILMLLVLPSLPSPTMVVVASSSRLGFDVGLPDQKILVPIPLLVLLSVNKECGSLLA